MRHYPSFFLAVAVGLMCSADAGAQTAACPALEARLASLDRTSDDYWNNDLRDTQAAIDRKRADLDQAMSSARRAGCYGGFLFKARQSGKNCKALAARVDRARSGLQKVETEQRSVAGDPYAAERERSRVVGELVANQCGRYASFERPGRRSTGLLSSIFGSRRFFRDRSTSDEPFGVGTYRTLCVRTCDGYYFPISFKASPGEFARDEGACRAMCPGTDVALYVHRNPGEQAEQMVSLAGQPYTALPTAFRYRKVYDRACTLSGDRDHGQCIRTARDNHPDTGPGPRYRNQWRRPDDHGRATARDAGRPDRAASTTGATGRRRGPGNHRQPHGRLCARHARDRHPSGRHHGSGSKREADPCGRSDQLHFCRMTRRLAFHIETGEPVERNVKPFLILDASVAARPLPSLRYHMPLRDSGNCDFPHRLQYLAAMRPGEHTADVTARIAIWPRSRSIFACRGAGRSLVALAGCASNMTKDGKPIDPLVVAMYAPVQGEPFPVPAIPISRVDPKLFRQTVATPANIPNEPPGTIVVDPYEKFLYLVQDGGQSLRYGIGVGKQGFAWAGEAQIEDKQHWPKWFPPVEMQARDEHAAKYPDGMDGGPQNPLGSRAMYLYEGKCKDGNIRTPNCRDTLYRIHATNEPMSIGKAVSSGCIRMWNQDVIDLYDRVDIGTKVVVLQGPGTTPDAGGGPAIAGAPLMSGAPVVVSLPASPAI